METLTTALAGLLQAIIEEPDSDDLRLIYADALADNGDEARAEFVRDQILIDDGHKDWVLLLDNLSKWFPIGVRDDYGFKRARDQVRLFGIAVQHTEHFSSHWYRGFASRILCTCAQWLKHGPAICRGHPVECVELVDVWERVGVDDHNRLTGLKGFYDLLQAAQSCRKVPEKGAALVAKQWSEGAIVWARRQPCSPST